MKPLVCFQLRLQTNQNHSRTSSPSDSFSDACSLRKLVRAAFAGRRYSLLPHGDPQPPQFYARALQTFLRISLWEKCETILFKNSRLFNSLKIYFYSNWAKILQTESKFKWGVWKYLSKLYFFFIVAKTHNIIFIILIILRVHFSSVEYIYIIVCTFHLFLNIVILYSGICLSEIFSYKGTWERIFITTLFIKIRDGKKKIFTNEDILKILAAFI